MNNGIIVELGQGEVFRQAPETDGHFWLSILAVSRLERRQTHAGSTYPESPPKEPQLERHRCDKIFYSRVYRQRHPHCN
eukprot:3786034-Amphidinium_carterae.1